MGGGTLYPVEELDSICDHAHERGLKVYTWTVDSDARMRALIECGVDGIMTNYPERLRTVQGG